MHEKICNQCLKKYVINAARLNSLLTPLTNGVRTQSIFPRTVAIMWGRQNKLFWKIICQKYVEGTTLFSLFTVKDYH